MAPSLKSPGGLCVLAIASLCALVGCEERVSLDAVGGTCRELYARFEACRPGYRRTAGDFVEACRKYPRDYAPVLFCGGQRDCPAFEACLESARTRTDPDRRENRLSMRLTELEEALADAEYLLAQESCGVLARDLDPDPMVTQLCSKLPTLAVRGLTVELTRLRDEDLTGSHISRCSLLRRFAGEVSDKAAERANQLCDEVSLSIGARDALALVDDRLARKDHRVPAECGRVLARLKRATGGWARGMEARVARRCYVDLGAPILAAGTRSCSFQLRRVIVGINAHGLEVPDARTRGALQKARKACSR